MELFINKQYECNKADIYLVEKNGGMQSFFCNDQGNIKIVSLDICETVNDTIKPLLTIPLNLLPIVLKLFGDEAEKVGINTQNEDLLRGKLIAMETHLQDMRDIVKHLLKMNK